MKLVIHIDGGARGNPGPAGVGVVIHDDRGRPLLEAGYFLGTTTNNQAEYTALIRGLDESLARGGREIVVHSDSELLVRQINGDYRVKNAGLAKLFNEVRSRLDRFERWTVRHVRREANQRADELANRAMDAATDVIEIAAGCADPPADAAATAADAPTVDRKFAVRCSRPPHASACRANIRRGAAFAITDIVPAGLCLPAAAAILEAILSAGQHAADPPRTVTCPKPGCGATFELRWSDQ